MYTVSEGVKLDQPIRGRVMNTSCPTLPTLPSAAPLLALCAREGFVSLADSPLYPAPRKSFQPHRDSSPRRPSPRARARVPTFIALARGRQASPCEHMTTTSVLRAESANTSASRHKRAYCMRRYRAQHTQTEPIPRVARAGMHGRRNTPLSLTLRDAAAMSTLEVCRACVNRVRPLDAWPNYPLAYKRLALSPSINTLINYPHALGTLRNAHVR